MRMNRMQKLRIKLVGLFAAGMAFQGAQCAVDTKTLLPGLFQSITSVWVTQYVNDMFGVTPSPF